MKLVQRLGIYARKERLPAVNEAVRVAGCKFADGLQVAQHRIALGPAQLRNQRQVIDGHHPPGGLRDSEIDDARPAVDADEHVLRRDVAMDDPQRLARRARRLVRRSETTEDVRDDRARLGDALFVILPRRARVAHAVECREIVGHLFAVDVPHESTATGRQALAFQNVSVKGELHRVVQLR